MYKILFLLIISVSASSQSKKDLEETKANEEIYKKLKIILKKHFTEYETLHLKEFQANLELIPSQLDGFLSI